MQKTLTQIPLDFGEEPNAPSPPSGDANGAGGQREGPYMATAGVGVRVKSYKNSTAPTTNVELFSEPALSVAAPAEPAAATETAAAAEPAADPKPAAAVMEEPGPPVAVAQERPRTPAAGKAKAAAVRPSKRGRKSLKQVAAEADLIDIPADEVLFGKQYYTMGEVSEMFKVNQSLLRYWETEFDILQPRKNKKGDRYFRPVDIKNLHLIYHLLRQKKYTIEGARDFLRKNKKARERFEVIERLEQIKSFLLEWKAQL
ncbi:MAG TPA: MerR family transcriptional regulator [Puia sp.]|jgi:DNA-binding transcriptional MerR regulator|nr:MerR family transcriptional regulator [Puia sp.]